MILVSRYLVQAWVPLALAMAAAAWPLQAVSAPPAAMVLAGDERPQEWGAQFSRLVLSEAFRRLGLSLEIQNLPLARRSAMAEAGEVDGDVGRVREFADLHPNLIRVEQPWTVMRFVLYTAASKPALTSLDDVRAGRYTVEYRRGIVFCEKMLKRVLPPEMLSDVATEAQGMKKLLAGRSDLYCDLEISILQARNSPELKSDSAKFGKALDLGGLAIYTYLHKKHAALAPRLAAALKQMKDEGLIDAYQAQVNQAFSFHE